MKKGCVMKGSILLLLGLSVLSACAYDKEVGVTYTCEPSGAVIYEEGIGRVGVCPVILKLGYLVDSSAHYILCMSVLAGTGSRFSACSTSREPSGQRSSRR